MFTLQQEHFGNFTLFKLINNNTGEYFSVIPEFGANINQLVLKSRDKNFSILDGAENYDELLENKRYKSAILAPFPNRIRNGEYHFQNKKYNLPINDQDHNCALHGLVFDQIFQIKNFDLQNNSGAITLEYQYNGNIPGYPFMFNLRLRYSLDKNGFSLNQEIKNTSNNAMPVGLGWHPYFKTGNKVNNLKLCLPVSIYFETDTQLIPTGKSFSFEEFKSLAEIGKTEFDHGFIIEIQNDQAETVIFDSELNLKIILWQQTGQKNYNYLQVYTPPTRDSIAIEPMTCCTDALNNNNGQLILEEGKSHSVNCGIRIE